MIMLRRLMVLLFGFMMMVSECFAYSSRGRVFREDLDDSYVSFSGKDLLSGIAFWLILFVVLYIADGVWCFLKKFYDENWGKKK